MNRRGMALALSFGVVTVFTTLGAAFLSRSLHESGLGHRDAERQAAFYLAEAGVDQASINLRTMEDLTDDLLELNLPTGRVQIEDPPESLGVMRWKVRTHGFTQAEHRRVEAIFLLTPQSVFQFALFGHERVGVSGSAITDSYDSREGLYDDDPASSTYNAGHNGDVGTNTTMAGGIDLTGGSLFLDGQAVVGAGVTDPLSVVTGYDPILITGGTSPPSDDQDIVAQANPFPMPDVVIPEGLPCVDQTIHANETAILAPGTYCYHNLTIDGSGALRPDGSGLVKVYVSGVLLMRGDSTVGLPSDPRKLVFLMATDGVARIEEGAITGSTGFYGALYGPHASINISGNAEVFGSIIAKDVTLSGNAEIHFDEAMTDLSEVPNLYQRTLVSWQDLN